MPERSTTTHALDRGLAERNRILANLHAPLRPPNFCRREEWEVVVQVPRKKIVNVVFAGIDSCHERRPGYRRNRRESRGQVKKWSLVAEPGQIWMSTFGDEPACEDTGHAVQSTDT